MRTDVKLSDYFYKEPPQLSAECLEEMACAMQAKDVAKAVKLWEEKYHKDISLQRNACLDNISNYSFMISLLGGVKNDNAEKVLGTFYMKRGFIKSGEKEGKPVEYICNYSKALEMYEKKSFHDMERSAYV